MIYLDVDVLDVPVSSEQLLNVSLSAVVSQVTKEYSRHDEFCWFQLSSVVLKYDFNRPELTECGVVTVKINIILHQLLSFL